MMNSFATAISIALQYGVPLETLVRKFSYMRFEPEGITQNPEIPFAKSLPDYIMRWLASRFLDADIQEELGIMTDEVRARKTAEETALSATADTAGPSTPAASPSGNGGGNVAAKPAAAALTDTPPVVPAKASPTLELGPACAQCGGMMQRTGSCYTCSSCGNNTGCGYPPPADRSQSRLRPGVEAGLRRAMRKRGVYEQKSRVAVRVRRPATLPPGAARVRPRRGRGARGAGAHLVRGERHVPDRAGDRGPSRRARAGAPGSRGG